MPLSVVTYPLSLPDDILVKLVLVSLAPHDQVGPHSHYTLELSMILSGHGEYMANNRIYPVGPGDIVLFNNTDIHSMRNTGPEPLVNMALEFEPRFLWSTPSYLFDQAFLDVFLNRDYDFQSKIDIHNPAHPHLKRQFEEIRVAFETQPPHHAAIIHARLIGMLAELLQHYNVVNSKPHNIFRRHSGMHQVLQYIAEHYAEPLSLATLSDIVHMNKTYFCRVFRDVNGISPKEYVLKTRIAAATKLLNDTDREILDIAQACGFNSLSNFYNVFKRITGSSPAQYRLNPLD